MSLYTADENGYRISKAELKRRQFFESIDPNLPPEEASKLVLDFLFDTDYKDLIFQTHRPDASARMDALVEAFRRAIKSDHDCDGWEIVKALSYGNMEFLVTALCGYGIHGLAKMAMLERDEEYEYHDCDLKGKMIVRWTNGQKTTSKCIIDTGTHGVYDYTQKVLRNPWNDDATVESVSIEVKPLRGGATYEFECVSQEEMEQIGSKTIYWYSTDPDDIIGTDSND